jgi:hypothetical protein
MISSSGGEGRAGPAAAAGPAVNSARGSKATHAAGAWPRGRPASSNEYE